MILHAKHIMKTIKVWGHRGASGTMPENTIPAFQRAIDMHADGIELDIQLTKDGEIVVIHDETIDRTSNGHGLVADYTLAELRSFNFNRTHPEMPYAQIPLMREVFELVKPSPLIINIELKTGVRDYPGIEEKIIAMTKEYEMDNRVIYSSFNHHSILRIKQLCPEARTAFLYEDGWLDTPDYGRRYQVTALHPAFYNLREPLFVKKTHDNGMAVNVWTVNTDDEVNTCMGLGVDAIITNYPDQVIRYLTTH